MHGCVFVCYCNCMFFFNWMCKGFINVYALNVVVYFTIIFSEHVQGSLIFLCLDKHEFASPSIHHQKCYKLIIVPEGGENKFISRASVNRNITLAKTRFEMCACATGSGCGWVVGGRVGVVSG